MSTDEPLITSEYLFKNGLAKQLRDAMESSKIRRSVGHSSQRRPCTGNQRSGQQERYNKKPKKHLLWKGPHNVVKNNIILYNHPVSCS